MPTYEQFMNDTLGLRVFFAEESDSEIVLDTLPAALFEAMQRANVLDPELPQTTYHINTTTTSEQVEPDPDPHIPPQASGMSGIPMSFPTQPNPTNMMQGLYSSVFILFSILTFCMHMCTFCLLYTSPSPRD